MMRSELQWLLRHLRRILRRILRLCLGGLAILLVLVVLFLGWAGWDGRRVRGIYDGMQKGELRSSVEARLGEPTEILTVYYKDVYWGWKERNYPAKPAVVECRWRHNVWVTYAFWFDEDSRLVGKHSYD